MIALLKKSISSSSSTNVTSEEKKKHSSGTSSSSKPTSGATKHTNISSTAASSSTKNYTTSTTKPSHPRQQPESSRLNTATHEGPSRSTSAGSSTTVRISNQSTKNNVAAAAAVPQSRHATSQLTAGAVVSAPETHGNMDPHSKNVISTSKKRRGSQPQQSSSSSSAAANNPNYNYAMHHSRLSSISAEQVMQLPVNPPSKSTPLHLLIQKREWTHVRVMLNVPRLDKSGSNTSSSSSRKKPSSSTTTSLQKALLQRDELGRTPLHLILHRRSAAVTAGSSSSYHKSGLEMKKAPPDLILDLLSSCPRAASIPDIKNNYPLHIAVMNGHRTDIVRTLLHVYPGAVLEQNEDMDTPLILAANFSLAIRSRQPQQQQQQQVVCQHIIKPFDSPEDITCYGASQTLELNDQTSREAFHKSQRWEVVSLLLHHRPDAACIRNRHEMSVLEMALQRHAPANVIRSLLRADKSAAAIQRRIVAVTTPSSPTARKGGTTPNDCHPPSVSSSATIGSGNGVMTPLSLAIVRDANEEVLGMLSFSFPPALQIRDECGVGPIAKCWLEWYYEVTVPTGSNTTTDGKQSTVTITCKPNHQAMFTRFIDTKGVEMHPNLHVLWLKLQTLLCAAHHPDCVRNIHYRPLLPLESQGKNLQEKILPSPGYPYNFLPIQPPSAIKFRPVHAASSQDCPIEVLIIAMTVTPQEASERDEFGRIPLHLAAEAPLYVNQNYEVRHSFETPIERLLQLYPLGSSVVDGYGRLPLHIAIRAGKKWNQGISSLVAADRRALNTKDPVTGLYPFMMAACRYGRDSKMSPYLSFVVRNQFDSLQWDTMDDREKAAKVSKARMDSDLDELVTIFEMLRACPGVLLPGLRHSMDQVIHHDFLDEPIQSKEGAAPQSFQSLIGEEEVKCEDENVDDIDLLYGVSDWSSSDLLSYSQDKVVNQYNIHSQPSLTDTKATLGVPDWDAYDVTKNTVVSQEVNDFNAKETLIQSGLPDWSISDTVIDPKMEKRRVRFNLSDTSDTSPADFNLAQSELQTRDGRNTKSSLSRFNSGQEALYTDSTKNSNVVTIVKVHFDDELMPYYDILLPNGKEKQTDDTHLAKLEEIRDSRLASGEKQEGQKNVAASRFQSGDEALYTDSRNNVFTVTIVKVHFDDELVPYYDVLLNGAEKQTDDAHLTKFGDRSSKVESKKIDTMSRQVYSSTTLPSSSIFDTNLTSLDYSNTAEESCTSVVSAGNPFDAFDCLAPLPPAPLVKENITLQAPPSHFSMDATEDSKVPFSSRNKSGQYNEKNLLLSTCINCQKNDRQTLLMPCRHLCLCSVCAENIDNNKCPLCKEIVESTIEVLLDYTTVL